MFKYLSDDHACSGFSMYVYHGPQRTRDVGELKKHSIVITTYNILATEFKDEDSGKKGKRGKKVTASSAPQSSSSSSSAYSDALSFFPHLQTTSRGSSSTSYGGVIETTPPASATFTGQSPLQEVHWLRYMYFPQF